MRKVIYVFISQPMNGKTAKDILEERQKALEKIKKKMGEDVIVKEIKSYFNNRELFPATVKVEALYWLGKSFELLCTADIAYFIGDWSNYRGCKLEHEAAVQYGIEVMEE